MSFDEVKVVHFQTPPPCTGQYYESRPCVFMNEGFDMADVKHISAVSMFGMNISHYYFTIKFRGGKDSLELRFDFREKAKALCAQRELLRAYTGTEEFAYVEKESSN